MRLEGYGRTDCGPVRDNNEDAFLVDVDNGIFVVADGMGGHAAGEVASWMAVEVVHRVLMGLGDPDETMLVRDFGTGDASDIMRERLRYSTLVMAVFDGDQAHLAHVGDSRAYLWRDGRLTRLTRDHTVVQQEIDAGRLTPELARYVPHRHFLTQSVGYQGSVEPDCATRVVAPGDVFMLCTDGLTDALDDGEIGEVLATGSSAPDAQADALLEAALAAGAEDNVTVVVVAAT